MDGPLTAAVRTSAGPFPDSRRGVKRLLSFNSSQLTRTCLDSRQPRSILDCVSFDSFPAVWDVQATSDNRIGDKRGCVRPLPFKSSAGVKICFRGQMPKLTSRVHTIGFGTAHGFEGDVQLRSACNQPNYTLTFLRCLHTSTRRGGYLSLNCLTWLDHTASVKDGQLDGGQKQFGKIWLNFPLRQSVFEEAEVFPRQREGVCDRHDKTTASSATPQ